ncbi:hypothetical protein B566_EDAN008744, partial [Ephemera danica]
MRTSDVSSHSGVSRARASCSCSHLLNCCHFLQEFYVLFFLRKMSSPVWRYFSKCAPPEDKTHASCNLCGKKLKTCSNTSNLMGHLRSMHHSAYIACQNSRSSSRVSSSSRPSSTSDVMPTSNQSRRQQLDEDDPAPADETDTNVHSRSRSRSPIARPPSTPRLSERSEPSTSVSSPPATPTHRSVSSCSREISTPSPGVSGQQTLRETMDRSNSYKPGGEKDSLITRALMFLICFANLPLSIVSNLAFRIFVKILCPLYTVPSRTT